MTLQVHYSLYHKFMDSRSYIPLARKYRPQFFSELRGQDTLTSVLTNGIKKDRLPPAFVLTGTRGIGKTTSARLFARALNCTQRLGDSVEPCGACENCQAISQGRHMDVIEMDAASHTGVDDIREIIDASQYRAVSAKYKVYIIDEVHMLSKSAFNALLKTLEEPPKNVKFLFATTEIKKVPQTVISRCMRFDLKPFNQVDLVALLTQVCEKEQAQVEKSALELIARSAQGSARDGLSILDQALTTGEGPVTIDRVADMLGLMDRHPLVDLWDAVLRGDVQMALKLYRKAFEQGADPVAIFSDLLLHTHCMSCWKIGVEPEVVYFSDDDLKQVCRDKVAELSVPTLTRIWQVLQKGTQEIRESSYAFEAGEMVLIRACYLSPVPGLEDLLKDVSNSEKKHSNTPSLASGKDSDTHVGPSLQTTEPDPRLPPLSKTTQESPKGTADPSSFPDIVALLTEKREPLLAMEVKRFVHLNRFEPGVLKVSLAPGASSDLCARLGAFLSETTSRVWRVHVLDDIGEPTLEYQESQAREKQMSEIKESRQVAEVLSYFPGAEIKKIEERKAS